MSDPLFDLRSRAYRHAIKYAGRLAADREIAPLIKDAPADRLHRAMSEYVAPTIINALAPATVYTKEKSDV